MIHIRNGPDFEHKVLDKTGEENWFEKFRDCKPSFSQDVREIVSNRNKAVKYPPTFLAAALYKAVKKKLKAARVPARELYFLCTIGRLVDLYRETDCFFYLKTGRGEAIVGIDLFFIHESLFKALKEFWIENSPKEIYTQEDLHSDLLRHSRIVTEIVKGRLDIGLKPEDLRDIVKFQSYRKIWLSDYVPQKVILAFDPERGERGYQNQLVVTPAQIVYPFQRRVLAGHIVELLVKQLVSKQLAFAS
jgi:hypothetical protein